MAQCLSQSSHVIFWTLVNIISNILTIDQHYDLYHIYRHLTGIYTGSEFLLVNYKYQIKVHTLASNYTGEIANVEQNIWWWVVAQQNTDFGLGLGLWQSEQNIRIYTSEWRHKKWGDWVTNDERTTATSVIPTHQCRDRSTIREMTNQPGTLESHWSQDLWGLETWTMMLMMEMLVMMQTSMINYSWQPPPPQW